MPRVLACRVHRFLEGKVHRRAQVEGRLAHGLGGEGWERKGVEKGGVILGGIYVERRGGMGNGKWAS